MKRLRAPAEYDAYYDADSAADHAFYETYATIALVVYAVGVPLAYLAWMLRARRWRATSSGQWTTARLPS